jgi:hypothetical protein
MELFDSLAILSPSKITTEERFKFASSSLNFLRTNLQNVNIRHIIVHDSPKLKSYVPRYLHFLFKSLLWDEKSKELYSLPGIKLESGSGKGSASALLQAVNIAISEGKTYGFIHLDDHVYCKPFFNLIYHGLDALDKNPDLLWTRFSGYPLIFNGDNEIIANNETISFDNVILTPKREKEYTLWSTPISTKINEGKYWPLALWFCIYRISFLKEILEWSIGKKHLCHVEEYYKNPFGFEKIIQHYPKGSCGYINMQFGGFEMHRNGNWQELLKKENKKIL